MPKTREKILINCFNRAPLKEKLNSVFPRITTILFCIIFICGFCFSTVSAKDAAQIKEDILSGIEKKYSGKSFEARFTQISKLAALDITEKASGKAFFSHPGKMRWEYQEPEHHEIITNGTSLWIFRPQENQVMQGNAASFFKSGAGGAFLSDISLIRKNYEIRTKEVTEDYVEIELTAIVKTPDISLIIIRITQKTYEIRRVVTYNVYDDTTLFEFDNIQFKNIDPAVFEFKAPQGSSIIDLD